MVNLEPQDDWNPSYPLMARAAFYCARLLFAQQGIEFFRSDYGSLKKVYSIWILTHPPRALRGAIARTELRWDSVIGDAGPAVASHLGAFDYANAVVVGLNGYDTGDYGNVVPLLDALLARDMGTDERLHIVRDGYRIVDSGIEREVREMESPGMQIALKAFGEGRAEGRISSLAASIASLVKTLGFTRDQAMDALEIPEGDRPRCNELLDGKSTD